MVNCMRQICNEFGKVIDQDLLYLSEAIENMLDTFFTDLIKDGCDLPSLRIVESFLIQNIDCCTSEHLLCEAFKKKKMSKNV